MDKQRKAPEWREPPRRFGELEPVDETAAWVDVIAGSTFVCGCLLALMTLAAAAAIWATDFASGHVSIAGAGAAAESAGQ